MGRDGLHYIAHYSIPANSWRAGVSRAALGITAALKTRLLNLSSQISPWHPNTKKIRERDRAVFSDTTFAELEPEKAGGGGREDGKKLHHTKEIGQQWFTKILHTWNLTKYCNRANELTGVRGEGIFLRSCFQILWEASKYPLLCIFITSD